MSTVTDTSPAVMAEDRGAVRVLTIHQPAKRNAFTGAMSAALGRELAEADAAPRVRAIVITGSAGSFSAGHDMQEMLDDRQAAEDPDANAVFARPTEMLTPVIAAVDGPAYGAGFILALSCDLRVASSSARFCAVGAAIGLVPVGGQLSRLLDLVSYPVAYHWLATAAPFDAEEAHRHGFVTTVATGTSALGDAIELAERIAEMSPAVTAAVKAGLDRTVRRGLDSGREAEFALARLVDELPDGTEGVGAFLERRPATYPDPPTDHHDRIRKALP